MHDTGNHTLCSVIMCSTIVWLICWLFQRHVGPLLCNLDTQRHSYAKRTFWVDPASVFIEHNWAGVACASHFCLSTEGYRLQFSNPCAYFVYTVWHCTGQHCSSIYACMYCLFACAMHVFEFRASSSSLGYLCANFVSFTNSIAELAHGETSCI